MAAAAVPMGYDLFPLALDSGDFDSEPQSLEEMHADLSGNAYLYDQNMLGVELSYVHLNSPVDSSSVQQDSHFAAASDAARSPVAGRARTSHQVNNRSASRQVHGVDSGSSVSPGTPLILTPTSTLLDYNASTSERNFDEEDDSAEDPNAISPSTSHTTEGDFVYVPRFPGDVESGGNLAVSGQTFLMNSRPPPSSAGASGGSAHPSRASSVAPPNTTSSTANPFSGVQWGSFTSTTDGWMDHNNPGANHSDAFGISASYVFDENSFTASSQQFGNDLLSGMGSFDQGTYHGDLPFRGLGDETEMFTQDPYRIGSPFAQGYPSSQHSQGGSSSTLAQQQRQAHYLAAQQHAMRNFTGGHLHPSPRLDIPVTSSLFVQQETLRTAPAEMEHGRLPSSQMQVMPNTARRSVPTVGASRASPFLQSNTGSVPSAVAAQQVKHQQAAVAAQQTAAVAAQSSRPLHALAKAHPAPVPSNAPSRASAADKGRRGGRQKHSHLPEQARQKSHKMRKVTACWRCALQRDPCDDGHPCGRCVMKSQKGQTYFFDCDRSKLPDFVHEFLPLQASMTLMHQKQTIEDCVNDQVLEWDQANPIDVYLTSGYGPALRWKLYEFRPRTDELLGQFQYLQDPTTGISRRYQKYSPPFGLLKLDASDDSHFENYLDQLLDPQYLWDLGWTCFEEETQVDPEGFQARLLDLMCKLYTDTQDWDLRELLRAIIRMMIITYIMGHTLTIVEDTLPSVITSVKLSPQAGQSLPHTSPRLANRQLKFFFAVLRNNIYEKILKWQQQTLHTSGKKDSTWLPAFCAMLGFAMVLEEVQRTIQIQADAKAAKEEMTHDAANTEAYNACERIDARFKLLVGLFQCKYRDKKWGEHGSFGTGTPTLKDENAKDFLSQLRQLLEERQDHLLSRRDVEFAPENQCLYTSRLVARFLLPFLGLPCS